MGTWLQVIADVEVGPEEAQDLADRIRDWLVAEGIIRSEPVEPLAGIDGIEYRPGPNAIQALDGPVYKDHLSDSHTVQFLVGRRVFHTYQSTFTLTCSHCAERADEGERWSVAADAIDAWYVGSGDGLLTCSHCDVQEPISNWCFNPEWGFGYLGIQFWDWPELKQDFISSVAHWLGHRVVYIYDKL